MSEERNERRERLERTQEALAGANASEWGKGAAPFEARRRGRRLGLWAGCLTGGAALALGGWGLARAEELGLGLWGAAALWPLWAWAGVALGVAGGSGARAAWMGGGAREVAGAMGSALDISAAAPACLAVCAPWLLTEWACSAAAGWGWVRRAGSRPGKKASAYWSARLSAAAWRARSVMEGQGALAAVARQGLAACERWERGRERRAARLGPLASWDLAMERSELGDGEGALKAWGLSAFDPAWELRWPRAGGPASAIRFVDLCRGSEAWPGGGVWDAGALEAAMERGELSREAPAASRGGPRARRAL